VIGYLKNVIRSPLLFYGKNTEFLGINKKRELLEMLITITFGS
jgi:hypothetical protein